MHVDTDLVAFLRDELPPGGRARVTAHLGGCAQCRRAADETRAVLDAVATGTPAPPPLDGGRYQVELRARVAARQDRKSVV